MDFLFSMSIFSSAAEISRETSKAQESIRAWSARKIGAKAVPAEPQKPAKGGARFALELDGINCFETIVSH